VVVKELLEPPKQVFEGDGARFEVAEEVTKFLKVVSKGLFQFGIEERGSFPLGHRGFLGELLFPFRGTFFFVQNYWVARHSQRHPRCW